MKHLQSYSLFESKKGLEDLIWTTLRDMASFPQLIQTREEAWAAVVGLWDWEEYVEHFSDRDDLPPMSEQEYAQYQKAYEGTPPAQITFDDFIASVLGHTEFPDEIQEGEDSLEWYMEHYEQPRTIAALMKTVANQSLDTLDLNPGWETIN